MTIQLVYVAGHGRSGSTLLDVLLHASPQLVGVGELHHFPRLLADEHECTCGAPLARCPFWADARDRLDDHGGPRAAAELTARVEATPTPTSDDLVAYRRLWLAVLGALAGGEGGGAGEATPVLVDSSKSMGYSRHRYAHLATSIDQFHLHLTRDPRGVTWSARKGPSAQFGRRRGAVSSVARSLYAWRASNRQAGRDAETAPWGTPCRYEDLVRDPAGTLQTLAGELSRWLGRPVEIPLLPTYEAGHGVGGNRMRFTAPDGISIRPDTSWHDEMPAWLAALAWGMSQPMAGRLGYRRNDQPLKQASSC